MIQLQDPNSEALLSCFELQAECIRLAYKFYAMTPLKQGWGSRLRMGLQTGLWMGAGVGNWGNGGDSFRNKGNGWEH